MRFGIKNWNDFDDDEVWDDADDADNGILLILLSIEESENKKLLTSWRKISLIFTW